MTWEHVEGNTVTFEITSAWRRKHHWPCKKDEGFNGPDGYPGLGQELSIVGLAMVNNQGEKRLEAAGQVASKFYPGDGAEYDLTLKVTSYSIKEDWLMGVSYVTHTYSKAQASLTPFYPQHYVARQVQPECVTAVSWALITLARSLARTYAHARTHTRESRHV